MVELFEHAMKVITEGQAQVLKHIDELRETFEEGFAKLMATYADATALITGGARRAP